MLEIMTESIQPRSELLWYTTWQGGVTKISILFLPHLEQKGLEVL